MRTPPSPWSLQWGSNGELSPLDRQDLLVFLCLPSAIPRRERILSLPINRVIPDSR
jgi:hypothetical protein